MEKIKKIYKVILENRYKFSAIIIVFFAIIGFFLNDVSIKEWILTTDRIFSLWWSIKFFALFLSSYELFYLITNQKKNLSVAGTIVVTFSGCVQWNFLNIDSLILGTIIIILIHKIVTGENLKKNIFCGLLTILCSIAYMYTFRPYAIAFGYVFFALILWILVQNRNLLKNNKSKIITISLTILFSVVTAILVEIFFGKYNGENSENFNSGLAGLYSYLYNCLLPFYNFEKRELLGSMVSVFPIPMFMALYYMYKKDKHIEFLLPITIVSVIETIYCISGFPNIVNKMTMLSGSSGIRVMPAVQLANIFIMFYFFGNIEDSLFKLKHTIRITIISICMLVFIQYPIAFSAKKFLYLFVCELSLLTFLLLNYEDKRYQKVCVFFLIIISLISGVPVSFFV